MDLKWTQTQISEKDRYRYTYNWCRFWDTLGTGVYSNSQSLFGPLNIGNSLLTNLQVAGNLQSDIYFYIESWDANILAEGVVTIYINDKPKFSCHVEDLAKSPRKVDIMLKPNDKFIVKYEGVSLSKQVRISIEGYSIEPL